MPKIRVATLIAAAITLLAVPAWGENSWERSFDVTAKPNVTIRTDDGSIQVLPGSSDRVEVSIETRGYTIGDDVIVKSWHDGNSVEVEARVPRRWWFGVKAKWIKIYVRVPSESDVDLISGDGSIEIESLTGQIDVRTGDGRIEAHAVTGELKLASGDGPIIVTEASGSLSCTTGDGRLRIQGRFDVLRLATGDGSVRVAADVGSKLERDWSIQTGDGSLVLGLPEDLSADIDASTGDGRIHFEVPVNVTGQLRRSRLKGTMNGGGPELRLRSGDGSITIERTT